MKNFVVTLLLAVLIVLASASLRKAFAIGGTPPPMPPNAVGIGGTPPPMPPMPPNIGGTPPPMPK
jgi:hypothetical protein